MYKSANFTKSYCQRLNLIEQTHTTEVQITQSKTRQTIFDDSTFLPQGFIWPYCLFQDILNCMRQFNLIAIIILFTVCGLALQETKKLIFVEQIFRHGARYPLNPTSQDFSNITNIINLRGQLTRQGQSQHYLLGKQLYQTYWEPLFGKNNKYRQQKFYFKSTDIHRTIQSLQAQLLGIFENTDLLKIDESQLPFSYPAWNGTFSRKQGDLFSQNRYFHPLPIHIQKGDITPWSRGDLLRSSATQFCYQQQKWTIQNQQDTLIANITSNLNFTRAIQAIQNAIHLNITFYSALAYIDNAVCLKYLGFKTLPIFQPNTQFLNQFNAIYVLVGYMSYYYSQSQLRATSTGFFNETVNHFKRVTQNQQGVQWAFYSAHDSTLQNLLSRMDLSNARCIYENYLNSTKNSEYCILNYPQYASQIIFQLYQYPNKTNTFQIRYNGNYRKIPFCGYQLQCKVEEFYNWYDSWKDENWVQSCGIRNHKVETYFSIIIIELGVIIVFAVAAILRYLNNKKPQVKQLCQVHPELQEPVSLQQNEAIAPPNQND